MCEYSDRLISFLDHELPAEDAIQVELHLETCNECREQVGVFTKVSREIDAYCHEAMALHARPSATPWVSVTVAAGVVTAVLALFLAWPRTRVTPPTTQLPTVAIANSLTVAGNAIPVPTPPVHRFHRRHASTDELRLVPGESKNSAPTQSLIAYTSADEPIIQIAIPADEVFPPGAVPEGMNFIADLTVAADGTAEGLRLRPRLVGFERRTTKP
jgi:hypothetical protein